MNGKLEEISSESGTARYCYDAAGHIRERILAGGITTRYTPDPLGRLTEMEHQKDGNKTDWFRYTYDPVGNITQIEKYRLGMEADSGLFRYAYDMT